VSDHTRSSRLLPDEVIRLKLSRSVTMYVLAGIYREGLC
jgi:hypothetical protein